MNHQSSMAMSKLSARAARAIRECIALPGCRAQSAGCRVQAAGCRVQGVGLGLGEGAGRVSPNPRPCS